MPITTLSYNYAAQQGNQEPASGACLQGVAADLNQISFSFIDANAGDNTAFLSAVVAGDQISCNGVTWSIEDATLRSDNVLFSVDPAQIAPPQGVKTNFGFSQPTGGGKLTLNVTIPAGESLSEVIDVASKAIAVVFAPQDWTPANITFEVSLDGTEFFELYDVYGQAILRALRPGTAMTVDQSVTASVDYIRVRSGTSDNPVPQEADRVLRLVTVPAA